MLYRGVVPQVPLCLCGEVFIEGGGSTEPWLTPDLVD